MDRYPKVAIIVLNWNRLTDILACLDSVYRLDYPHRQVIVVDNASTDDSITIIHSRYPDITIVRSDCNLGFAGGNNVGIRYALMHGAEYVWLLNNDTVVEPDALLRLMEAAETYPDAGLLSPIIHFHNNPYIVQFPGSYIDWHRFDMIFCTEKQVHSDEKIGKDVILWGTALLIKESVLRKVGLLDEKYFAYDEDADLCIRANRGGFRGYPVTAAKVYHKDTPLRGHWKSPLQAFLRTRNRYFLWMTHLPPNRKVPFLRQYMAELVMQAREMELARQSSLAAALYKGLWNGMIGKGGDPAAAKEVPTQFARCFRWMTAHPWFWRRVFAGDYVSAGTGFLRRFLNR